MSDAAQKAVEKALRRHFVMLSDEAILETAHTVLAVLSETHAVVELPEGDDAQEMFEDYGLSIEPTEHLQFGMPITRTDDETQREEWLSSKEAIRRGTAYVAIARVAEGGGSRG